MPVLPTAIASLKLCGFRSPEQALRTTARSGLEPATVARILDGATEPTLTQFKALASACGMSMDALVAGVAAAQPGQRRPGSYVPATVHTAQPVEPADQRFAFALDLADGTPVRVHLSEWDAMFLVSSLRQYMPQALGGLPACHSETAPFHHACQTRPAFSSTTNDSGASTPKVSA